MTTGKSMPRVSLKTIGENWAAAPEQKAALLTTDLGWHYKFDSRSNNTVQKRRSDFY
jgi:hypothetical protein